MNFYKPYKNTRLKKYDYHTGYFFITNKTNKAESYLVGNNGDQVKRILLELSKVSKGVKVDYLMIMPNHIHCIVVFNEAELSLSEFWRRFKALTTFALKKSGLISESLWQKNYYEHIIRNEVALNRIRKYIEYNPYKENLPLREIYLDISTSMR
ncbi:transposase [Candidatus Woesebacteria bacterium]|nr:transposase [Candidatus Woesebacteria bacterium]